MKQLLILFLLAPLLQACDDDAPPEPITWREAQESWATGLCLYAQRCQPDLFGVIYGDQDTCVAEVTELNCAEGSHDCADQFPQDRREALDKCEAEMTGITCTATEAPESCQEAFQ